MSINLQYNFLGDRVNSSKLDCGLSPDIPIILEKFFYGMDFSFRHQALSRAGWVLSNLNKKLMIFSYIGILLRNT